MSAQTQTLILFGLNILIGLLLALTAFSVRRLVFQIDRNTGEVELLKLRLQKTETECAHCRQNMLTEEKMRRLMTESIRAAMIEMELRWVNEGRIMPKYRQKKPQTNTIQNKEAT